MAGDQHQAQRRRATRAEIYIAKTGSTQAVSGNKFAIWSHFVVNQRQLVCRGERGHWITPQRRKLCHKSMQHTGVHHREGRWLTTCDPIVDLKMAHTVQHCELSLSGPDQHQCRFKGRSMFQVDVLRIPPAQIRQLQQIPLRMFGQHLSTEARRLQLPGMQPPGGRRNALWCSFCRDGVAIAIRLRRQVGP